MLQGPPDYMLQGGRVSVPQGGDMPPMGMDPGTMLGILGINILYVFLAINGTGPATCSF